MPVVSLTSYFTHIDAYGRWWFRVPRDITEGGSTLYKLSVLERNFAGNSPVHGFAFWTYPKKNGWSKEGIEAMKGSLVTILAEFKKYFGAPGNNPVGWNFTLINMKLVGDDLTLS